MRILHLMNGLEIGGRERVVLGLAERGRGRGIESQLVLFDHPYRDEARDLDPGDTPWRLLPRQPGMDWSYPRRLARVVREERIDLIHGHNDTAVFYGSLAARWAGRRAIGTFHTWPPPTRRGGRWLTQWAGRLGGPATAVSGELAQRLQRAGWCHRPRVIWNGIDPALFSPEGPGRDTWRESWGVPSNATVVGHIGRFDPIKRQVDLVAALQVLDRQDVHLVLLGQGPTAVELPRDPRLHHVPSTQDVAGFLRAIDLFALPSDHECSPRVLLEAMAAGKPCIVSRVGGMPEMLELEGEDPAGIGVAARAPRQLAQAIIQLIEDPEQAASLGRRAALRVQDYSQEGMDREYETLYCEVLA